MTSTATDFPADRRKFSTYWQKGSRLLGRLPPKPRRNEGEGGAGRWHAATVSGGAGRPARLRVFCCKGVTDPAQSARGRAHSRSAP